MKAIISAVSCWSSDSKTELETFKSKYANLIDLGIVKFNKKINKYTIKISGIRKLIELISEVGDIIIGLPEPENDYYRVCIYDSAIY